MKVTLIRISGSKFEATNEAGNLAIMDGPEIVGGVGAGVRPMEMVLMGLAGCAAVDVLLILQKGRRPVKSLEILVNGERVNEIPAVFSTVHLTFIASGAFKKKHLDRAADLSIEKYCSVAKMLRPNVTITHETVLKGHLDEATI